MIYHEKIINDNSKISVVIPTYKRPQMLLRLLESLLGSTIQFKEIIVIDGYFLSDNIRWLSSEFPFVRYFKFDHNAYVGEMRNRGLEISHGDYVYMVDDDNIVKNDCVEKLYKAMINDDLIGVAGPVTCYFDERNIIMYAGGNYSPIMRRTIFLKAGENVDTIKEDEYEVDGFANSYMFKKEAALKVYPIPDRILFGGEDGYIQYRIKKELRLKIILIGGAIVYHDIKKNEFLTRMTPFKLYYLTRGKITFELDLDRHKYRFLIFLFIFILGNLYIAINSEKKKEGLIAVLRGLFDGIFRNYPNKY